MGGKLKIKAMAIRNQLLQRTEAYWNNADPILPKGEPGYITGTPKHKIGDGSSRWSALTMYGDATSLIKGEFANNTAALAGNLVGGDLYSIPIAADKALVAVVINQ